MAEEKHTGNPGNFAEDRERASRAGQVGGQHSSGNFAKDPQRAAEVGRKGGQASHGSGGAERNPGNFTQDREKPAGAGRKDGQTWLRRQSNGSRPPVLRKVGLARLPSQVL